MASDLQEVDRISDLPKEVTDEILRHMPIKDAVKTSLLSTHWKCKWMHMPHLVFPYQETNHETDYTELVSFVNNVLLLHQGAVYHFELRLCEFERTCCSELDNWISILSRKMVNHLYLIVKFFGNPYQVHESLFSCQTLRFLTLGCCMMKLPSCYQGFCCLTTLQLYYVTSLSNDTVEILLRRVPLLQNLTIAHCTPVTRFDIVAPNLGFLCITGSCDSIDLDNAQDIRVANIQVWRPECRARCSLDKIIGGLHELQGLIFHHPFLEFSRTGKVPERLGITFHKLQHVKLHINFEDLKQTVALVCLCRSSPSLEMLKIEAVWEEEPVLSCGESFWGERLHKEDGILQCLQSIQLANFKGLKCELGFTRFILLNAVVLKAFLIKWEESIPMEETLNVQQEVMQFKNASSTRKVIFEGKS